MNQRAARPKVENLIAIVALVLGALIPSLVQLLATPGSGNTNTYAMCTSTGMKFVKLLDSGDQDEEGSGTAQVVKCSLCLWNNHALGIVSVPADFTHPDAISPAYQAHTTGPPASPAGWFFPPPRAPPVFS